MMIPYLYIPTNKFLPYLYWLHALGREHNELKGSSCEEIKIQESCVLIKYTFFVL